MTAAPAGVPRCRPASDPAFSAGLLAAFLLVPARPATAQSPFDPIVADLRSPKASTRIGALRTLIQSGYPQVLTAIAPLVQDPSNEVQLEAIDALLTVCLAPAPSPQQSVIFKAENGSIAPAVFDALPLAVLPRAVPPDVLSNLSAALKDDDARIRTGAALALGVLGSAALGPRTDDADRTVTTDVVYALRHPDPATREAILRAAARLFEPPPHASAPVAIGDAVIAAMNDSDTRVRLWASDTLGWLRERRAAPALGERLAYFKRGPEAEAALHALARIAPPAAQPTFRAHLVAQDAPMRVMALEGLGRIRDDSALPVDHLRARLGEGPGGAARRRLRLLPARFEREPRAARARAHQSVAAHTRRACTSRSSDRRRPKACVRSCSGRTRPSGRRSPRCSGSRVMPAACAHSKPRRATPIRRWGRPCARRCFAFARCPPAPGPTSQWPVLTGSAPAAGWGIPPRGSHDASSRVPPCRWPRRSWGWCSCTARLTGARPG